ncbi:MAG TPA: PDZ domain-containing protein, partial [Gaiellaceae bacterium]|nr:PDZ domain-containing protein [Gaiellaceae bacterium]
LGVGLADVPASVAEELGLAAGAAITEVRDGSPAAEAGLRPSTGTAAAADGLEYPTGGDIVTALDGEPVASAEDLQRAVGAHRPGDTVTLTVVRDGETREVQVQLAERPA